MTKTQIAKIRAARAQVLIKQFEKSSHTRYGKACLKIAISELECGVYGYDNSTDRLDSDVLKDFNSRRHTVCEMVNDQCVLCGSTE